MVKAISNGQCWLPPKFVGEADLGGRLALLESDGQCVLYAQHQWSGMCQGSMGRMANFLSS